MAYSLRPKVSEKKEQNFKGYLASSAISIGFILVVMEVTRMVLSPEGPGSYSASFLDKITILFMAIHLIGGSLGAFVLAARTPEKPISMGIVTALLTYIIEYVYFYLFGGLTSAGFIILITLIIGGVSGVMLANLNIFSSINVD